MSDAARQRSVRLLRWTRTVHRYLGMTLFVLFVFVSLSGLLLTWKKNSGGYLLPDSERGTSTDLRAWLPTDSLAALAAAYLAREVSPDLDPSIDRIDMRPGKGMVKIVFKNHYYGLQLDGATGTLLHVGRRRADFIENVHDGSVLDNWLGTSGWIKLIYSSVTGTALLLFTITGFWLWYGPRRLRAAKRRG
ncbi:MAG: PepSY-associated TM helix domain-containing protein [Saprospiraceae bacterium]